MSKSQQESPVQKEIDDNLKRIFDATANEPLPPKLKELLSKLKEQEKS